MMRSIPLSASPAQFGAFEERHEARLEALYAEHHDDTEADDRDAEDVVKFQALLAYEAGLEASE